MPRMNYDDPLLRPHFERMLETIEHKVVERMILEERYVGERMQQGTMTPAEARAWLISRGHPGGKENDGG